MQILLGMLYHSGCNLTNFPRTIDLRIFPDLFFSTSCAMDGSGSKPQVRVHTRSIEQVLSPIAEQASGSHRQRWMGCLFFWGGWLF
jgi:hypothetical protein